MKMNRRTFLWTSWAIGISTQIPLSEWPKVGSSFISAIKPNECLLEDLSHSLMPDEAIIWNFWNHIFSSAKVQKFQQWFSPFIWNQTIPTLRNTHDLSIWLECIHKEELIASYKTYINSFNSLPKNVRTLLLEQNWKHVHVWLNFDSIKSYFDVVLQWLPQSRKTLSFNSAVLKWTHTVWEQTINFSYQLWELFTDVRIHKVWTWNFLDIKPTYVNTEELSQMLKMTEKELLEHISTRNAISKIKAKSWNKSQSKHNNKSKSKTELEKNNKIISNETNITWFASFLLSTSSLTDIRNYTWNQVQEILDYIDEKEIKNLVKID